MLGDRDVDDREGLFRSRELEATGEAASVDPTGDALFSGVFGLGRGLFDPDRVTGLFDRDRVTAPRCPSLERYGDDGFVLPFQPASRDSGAFATALVLFSRLDPPSRGVE